jgi:hypothetical protein
MKVFELKIDEEDDLSGVSLLSLVKEPATQITWEVFNQETEPISCDHKADLPQEALDLLDNYGTLVSPEAFFSATIKPIDELVIENFAVPNISPNPRAESFGDDTSDTASVISRYIYVVDTGVGAPLKPLSRQLCRKMLLSQKVWSKSDIQNYSMQLTAQGDTFNLVPRAHTAPEVDFLQYKGGNRCCHRWQQIDFPIGLNETYEQALARIPLKAQSALGTGQNIDGVGRPFISEARYMGRLPKGSRPKQQMSSMDEHLPIAFHMGLYMYSTRFAALSAEPTAKIITKVKMGDMIGYCPVEITPEYFEKSAEVVEHFKVRETFAVPTKEIQDIAQKVVDWTEENGWGDCGTPVGKTRASQLAKGENLSVETITRMYSYLSRHKGDLQSSKSYDDGCGKLMYDSWGGEPALAWAEREMKKATEMNVMFSADDFMGDITSVVFQPNQKIYRYDAETNSPYWVFMSRDTIRQMLMKFQRLQQTGKVKGGIINYEHTDYVFNPDDVYSYENWLVGDNPELDKSYELFGRTFEPGTWMTTIHFNNRAIFDEFILSNETSGISLEGLFQEVPFNFFDVKEQEFIEPKPGQSKDDYLAECIPYAIKEGKTQEQAAGMCYGMWENKMSVEQMAGEKISFDYDGTLSTKEGFDKAKQEIENGNEVYIISARNDKSGMLATADELGIPHDRVFATGSNKSKVEKIIELGIKKHYDNNQDVIDELGSIGEKFITEYIPYDEYIDGVCNDCWDMPAVYGFKPYAWEACIKDMTEKYGETAAPKICGKIKAENMAKQTIDELKELLQEIDRTLPKKPSIFSKINVKKLFK